MAFEVSRVLLASLVGTFFGYLGELRYDPSGNLADILVLYILWNVGAFVTYAVLTWGYFRKLDRNQLQTSVRRSQPRSRLVTFLLAGGRASDWGGLIVMVSLGAVLAVAVSPSLRRDVELLVMCVLLVITGSLMMLYGYAVHYLRLDIESGGLRFPGETPPVFSDYLYFAQQIQTTYGGSDVEITSTQMRRTVNTHNLLSFVFATVVVALLVSAVISANPG